MRFLISAALAVCSFAQDPVTDESKQVQASAEASIPASIPSTPADEPPGGKRIAGVLPNYRTADRSQENTSISASRKLDIARRDSFDYPLVGLSAALAGIGQLSDQQPSFGQGLKGYSHRLLTNYADQAMGNMFTEGFFPAMLHEDPRYFRRGTGGFWSRTGYAVSRVMVTHKDSGGTRFNYSEWLGNASAVAISNAYYPDNRNAIDNTTKLLSQVATDALSQVLKEFWPDVRRKFFSKNKN
jgi:hypothetical protein